MDNVALVKQAPPAENVLAILASIDDTNNETFMATALGAFHGLLDSVNEAETADNAIFFSVYIMLLVDGMIEAIGSLPKEQQVAKQLKATMVQIAESHRELPDPREVQ